MGKFEKQWKEYERRVVPPGAGDAQRRATKRAFYAGALILVQVQMGMLENLDSGNVTANEVGAFAEVADEIERELARMATERGGARA